MGFGWLFLGYLTALFLSVNSFGFLFVPVGLVMMLIGVDELRLYNKRFLPAMALIGVSFLISVYQLLAGLSEKFGLTIGFVSAGLDRDAQIGQTFSQLCWTVLLLIAIASLAGTLELGRIRMRALRNFFYAGAYYLLTAYMDLFAVSDDWKGPLLITGLILYLLCFGSDLILFLNCYMRICPQGEEDMPRKKSRFAVVNQFRENYDKEEEKTADATKKWLLERRAKNNEKWQKKNGGKHGK